MPESARALTTHVLDTARGLPAPDLEIVLARRGDEGWTEVARARTNADGRTERPLLAGEELTPGAYELRFDVGGYFAALGVAQQDPPFLGVVPVRCAVAADRPLYHVPLLCSPWSYSTYLGS
jgi:5-hydroxyisourate hydrolase